MELPSADTPLPAARVRGASGNREPERDRPRVCDDDIEERRLRDDGEIAGCPRGQRALAAVLLVTERDDQLPGEAVEHFVARSARTAPRMAGTPPFSTRRARIPAVTDLARPRVGPPGSPGGNDVHVAAQHQTPAAGPTGPGQDPTVSVSRVTSSPGQADLARISAG